MVDPPLEGKLFQNEKKIQSFHKLFNSKSPIGCDHGRILLWRFLHCVDLLEDSNRTLLTKSLFRLLLFLSFVMYMDNIVEFVTKFRFKTDDSIFRASILHFNCYVISAIVWYALRQKRKNLTSLLKILRKRYTLTLTKPQILVLLFIYSSAIIVLVLFFTSHSLKNEWYIYEIKTNYTIFSIVNCIRILLQIFIYPIFTNLVAFLYCFICQSICDLVTHFTSEIRVCPFEEFTVRRQTDILRKMSGIENALNLTQKVFSVPSFLISVSHFCSCIAILAVEIYLKDDLQLHRQIEWFLIFMNSFCGLLAILWKAGSLPIEAEKLKRTYRIKFRQKLLSENKVGELHSEMDLIDTSNFVLSGCNIIYFYRSSLLALAGTILTYTVLLMSQN
ncbi:uncharacterized protein TNIN_352721 [Trichonephila inaurata madagascariensis]|uniref:Gustatory receptor n=1 Tax=Trichonephila inaurata madagascariensis TaxID=2747483 RepID=A0A8X6YVK9_9ARAC|nr:uncharacterized protein TNIN_352721 [Trichonephila inaurata madagascariensis]